MSKLEINNLKKKLDRKSILKDISITIESGEFVSLLGVSGAGKSTILNCISGFLGIDSGEIKIDNNNIESLSVQKRDISVVDQEILLFNHMTVYDNIGFGLKMIGEKKASIYEKVMEMAKNIEMIDYLEKYPNDLSGGQRQRVAIGRALIVNPKLLLLDEPFSKLDTKLRESLQRLVKNIQKKYKVTSLLVTHDRMEAMTLSDKIGIIYNGEIVDYGKPSTIYNNPKRIETIYLLGEFNVLEENVKNGKGRYSFTEKKYIIDGKYLITIQPKHIKISLEKISQSKGTIIEVVYLGESWMYTIEIEGSQLKVKADEVFVLYDKVYMEIDLNCIIYYKDGRIMS